MIYKSKNGEIDEALLCNEGISHIFSRYSALKNRWPTLAEVQRNMPKMRNAKNAIAPVEHDVNYKKKIPTLSEEKLNILFSHFSPFKYEVEGLGLLLYAAKAFPNATIHFTYDKHETNPLIFEATKEGKTSRINGYLEKYDAVIARSNVLVKMQNRATDKLVLDNSGPKVLIKHMSLQSNMKFADLYFNEEDFYPLLDPECRDSVAGSLDKFNKEKIILLPGTLWSVKTQLDFIRQVDSKLIKGYHIIFVGPLRDKGYVQKIISECDKKDLDYSFLGNVSDLFLMDLFALSEIVAIPMDPKDCGQPGGYPRVLGEAIGCRCICVCAKTVTVPPALSKYCLSYDHHLENELNNKLSDIIDKYDDVVKDRGIVWDEIIFEDICQKTLVDALGDHLDLKV